MRGCLAVLQAVPEMPVSCLPGVLGCLCRTICVEEFSEACVAVAAKMLNQTAQHAVLGVSILLNFLRQRKVSDSSICSCLVLMTLAV